MTYKTDGLVIASGYSSRMGKFKPAIEFNGKSFVETIVEKLLHVCETVAVTTGNNSEKVVELLNNSKIELLRASLKAKKLKIIFNENFDKGMFTSLKKGLEKFNNDNFCFYHFVDQPHIPQKFYEDLTATIKTNYDWIQPVYNNRKGHPIIFSEKVKSLILSSSDDENLKSVSNRSNLNKYFVNLDYKEILEDIDFPEDIKKFLT